MVSLYETRTFCTCCSTACAATTAFYRWPLRLVDTAASYTYPWETLPRPRPANWRWFDVFRTEAEVAARQIITRALRHWRGQARDDPAQRRRHKRKRFLEGLKP